MAQRACLPGCDSDTLMERRALGDRRPGGNPVFEQMDEALKEALPLLEPLVVAAGKAEC